jgi:glycosyltransferase involved in cell wall biosynthesis
MRLLVLTHSFPPSTHANAKRPYYLVKGFLEAGWQVDVFTHPVGMSSGATESMAHPALRLFRLSDPVEELFRRCRPHRGLFRIVALGAAGLMWPDTYAWWARKVFRAIHARPAYDRALAFILPASLLLSGRRAGLVNRGWTFDYQEPITPQQRHLPRRSPLQQWLVPRLARLERDTLRQAGRVIFTADANRQAYVREGLVAASVTAHVPYFFDAEAFAQPAPPASPDFEIVYFGSFDWRGARSPETFLRSLTTFRERVPQARPRTRFVFYGSWLAEHDRFLDELRLRDVVSLRPAVGYGQYIERLRQSPVLLLVVAAAHNLFMPSKIVDYFGARRPIMAFVPRESEMRQVLTRAGMAEFVCDESDVTGGAMVLEKLWRRYEANALVCGKEETGFWSSQTQVPRYVELVKGCAEQPTRG